MLNRVMRSGRTYDPGQAPAAPKRRIRKTKAIEESEVEAEKGEQVVNKERRLITFGSVPADDLNEEALVLQGAGRRKGVAWVKAGGVKVSPAVYRALTNRTPPIKPKASTNTREADTHPTMEARKGADACKEADAPESEREDSPKDTQEATHTALGGSASPDAAQSEPCALKSPKTPTGRDTGSGLEFDQSGATIFVTARTSRVLEDRSEDEESAGLEPQYIVLNESPSNNRAIERSHVRQETGEIRRVSWFDEMRKADVAPETGRDLPELDIEWYRDHWSRSDYLSVPETEQTSEYRNASEGENVRVSAIICEVNDDYVLDDEEYEATVLKLQALERARMFAESQVPSQTSGAGPSGSRRSPRVTVEEIVDEDAPRYVVISSDEEESDVLDVSRKGKGKEPTRKNRPRRSLGVAIDEIEPVKADINESERRQSSRITSVHRSEYVPDGFRSGGYIESRYGKVTSGRGDRSDTRTIKNESEIESPRIRSPQVNETRAHRTGRNHRTTPPDDSDGSNGSDSEASSSDTETEIANVDNDEIRKLLKRLIDENKKLKKKTNKQARSGYKAQAPKIYKGEEPNLEEYEQFVFDYDNWVYETGISRETAVRNVSRFLSGKAARWYMAKIAPNLGKVRYEVEDVYKLMYEYCFPPDFKETLRKRYESIRQGARCVQDFFADLELYRTRLSDITDLQHVRRAWDGAARHIRAEWAMKGYRADNATFDQLKAAALDIERSYNVSRNQVNEHVKRDSHKGERSRSPDRKRNRKDERSRQNPQSNTHQQNKSSRERERSSDWKKSKLPINSQQTGNSRSNLTDEQKERYRAEDRCYLCHKVGHMARNCTKANSAKPTGLRANAATLRTDSKVRASSVIVKEINQLYQTKDTLGISSVKVDDEPVRLNAAKTKSETVGFIERNAVRVKDNTRLVPQTIVVRAKLNGETIRALLDSGSQADILSTTIVDQLHITRVTLTKPLQLQLAISGSKSTVNYGASARLQYQGIDEERDFDVGNLDGYDAILGTPWLYQHCVSVSFNPTGVVIGSNKSLPLEGAEILRINSVSTDAIEGRMEELRSALRNECSDLCPPSVASTPLPPFRKINHRIPLIDDTRIYKFRPSKCAEKLRPLFDEKAREYLQTGRWELTTGSNAVPMLILTKKSSDGSVAIRTVLDKREQNDNTVKLASPLPPPEDVLLNVSRKKFRSVIDGKDAYEQIRVVPEDVPKTLFHTPLGTMVSMVMQQGDCNAGATYQSLMNHLFQSYIGVFMYVYLDDIVIFSDTIEEHVEHIRTVADILRREKFYLSPKKMQFFARELILLGHVIDEKGIRMDPHKVDSIEKWKTPTTKDQVASYIGALGYLAPNCEGLRRPMAILSKCSSGKGLFRWDGTEERAFRETQQIVRKHRNTHRVALDYRDDADPIFLITDASLTGASGVLSQGKRWKESNVIQFWSGKFDSAQQNYPVHDREALAIIMSLKKFEHLLQGVRFEILTDHRALEHLVTQKKLSGRQVRWLDTLSRFHYKIKYIEGTENVLADALSRMYGNDNEGVERAISEYVNESNSEGEDKAPAEHEYTRPVLVGVAALVAQESGVNSDMVRRNPTRTRVTPKRYDPIIPGREPSMTKKKQPRKEPTRIQEVTRGDDGQSEAPRVSSPQDRETTQIGPTGNTTVKEDSPPDVEPEGEEYPNENFEILIPQVTEIVTELDVIESIRGNYANDKQFGPIVNNPESFPNYQMKDGLLYMDNNDETVLCIPDCSKGEYKVRQLIIAHAHSVLAHQGNRKTYLHLRETVWWKSMSTEVSKFCQSCTLCAASKPSTQHPYGLLKPLPVPKFPWSQVGMDFMGPLPASRTIYGEFDTICVVLDHLTLMTHLIPTRQDYTAKDMAQVYYTDVAKIHGYPDIIVSDRDKLFTSDFHKELNALVGTELAFSSNYHPETDGLVERKNRSVGSMLRTFVNRAQRDWAPRLPGVEFAINSARSETTGYSPFKLNYGRLPRPMLIRTETDLEGVKQQARAIRSTQMMAHDAILAQRPTQTLQANKGRRPAPFVKGSLVFVSTKNMAIPEGKSRKLVNKYIGPLVVEEVIVEGTTYKVKLPDELKRRGIRPTFHASLLKPHIPGEDNRFPRHDYQQFVGLEGDEDQWSVERITSHRGRGNRALFQVLWHGGEITWEPYKAIKHLLALRQYFEAQGVTQASQLPLKDEFLISDSERSESDNHEIEYTGNKNLGEILRVHSIRILKNERGVGPTNSLPLPYPFTYASTELVYTCLIVALHRTAQGSDRTTINVAAPFRLYFNPIYTTHKPDRTMLKPPFTMLKPQRTLDSKGDKGADAGTLEVGEGGTHHPLIETTSQSVSNQYPEGKLVPVLTLWTIATDPDDRAGRNHQVPGKTPERMGRTRRRSESPELERKRARIHSPDSSQPYTNDTNRSTSPGAGATNRLPTTEGPRIPRGPTSGTNGGDYAGCGQYPKGNKGPGDIIGSNSHSGQPAGVGAGLTIPRNDEILAFAASYPSHVIQAYQEAWRLTQEYNGSFGFGLGTGLGTTILGPSDGVGDFEVHRQSMEDHQLRAFDDSSERASVTAPNTPSTVQGDLPQGSHHRPYSGLSIPVPIEQLAIGDSEMLDAEPIGTRTPTNPGLQPTPELVPNQSGSVETTSKKKQLGGTETQDPGARREGEGEAFRKDKEGTGRGGEGVEQGPRVMEVTDKFTTQVDKET
ncbi:hypothetical protein RHS03_08195, partial [Rhizoctonia solani]